MNKLMTAILLTMGAFIFGGNQAGALPPPCTQEQLMESSNYAVEGLVEKVECGEPYKSDECRPNADNEADFVPELFSDCTAYVKITKIIKGDYKPGDTAEIPFKKVAQDCVNGSKIIPGSPTADLMVDTNIRYYTSELCKYWNLEILTPETSEPAEDK